MVRSNVCGGSLGVTNVLALGSSSLRVTVTIEKVRLRQEKLGMKQQVKSFLRSEEMLAELP